MQFLYLFMHEAPALNEIKSDRITQSKCETYFVTIEIQTKA